MKRIFFEIVGGIVFIALFFSFVSFFLSCSGTKAAEKRIFNIAQQHPELIELEKDTLKDTLATPTHFLNGIHLDSLQAVKDSFVIVDSFMQLKYIRHNDTVQISGVCLPDTIIKEFQYTKTKIVIRELTVKESFSVLWKVFKNWAIAFIVLLILAIIIGLALRFLR